MDTLKSNPDKVVGKLFRSFFCSEFENFLFWLDKKNTFSFFNFLQ